MIYVIDGFNLIYKFPELEELMYNSKLDQAREGLLQILHKFQLKRKNATIYTFFDGKKGTGNPIVEDSFGKIRIHFSHDSTADFYIKQFIKTNSNPSDLTVITSDNDLIGFCKRYSSKNQKSEDFTKYLESIFFEPEKDVDEKETDVKLSVQELEYWKNLFQKKGK
jgi:uncharacterized protein